MKADHGAIKLENQGLLRIGMTLCPNCQMTTCGLNQYLVQTPGCSTCQTIPNGPNDIPLAATTTTEKCADGGQDCSCSYGNIIWYGV